MARVDFYHLSRDPVERVLPAIAQKILDSGKKLLVVADDDALLTRLSEVFWAVEGDGFLPNGLASAPDAALQPIILASDIPTAQGDMWIALADAQWRDAALDAERLFYLFVDDSLTMAREAWRAVKADATHDAHFWKQDGGRWREAG